MNFEILGKTNIRDMSPSEIRGIVDALQKDVFTKNTEKTQTALNAIQFIMDALELEEYLHDHESEEG
jgi:hypothetical protein